MRSEREVEAAAAAEKANGGKFSDPLFYKPEHRVFWHQVIRAALEAADSAKLASKKAEAPPTITDQDVAKFSEHCVLIQSVYTYAIRLFKERQEFEFTAMKTVAPSFFEDLAQVFAEFAINSACRVTDPANEGRWNQNFTAEMFVNGFSSDAETYNKLSTLHKRMLKLREKIEPARNKIVAHADRAVVRKGEALGKASWEDWSDFWAALEEFVNILNLKTNGAPYEIKAARVLGDVESLLKALAHNRCKS